MIALLGPRGCGKSTVGRLLAARLGRPFVDLDEEVARVAGEPAAALLARDEATFREAEIAALARVAASGDRELVLATGGGTPIQGGARPALGAFVRVYLETDAATLRERLRADPTARPALRGADPLAEIEEILAERESVYRTLADLVVPTGGRPAVAVADALVAALRPLCNLEKRRLDRRPPLQRP